MNECTLQDAVKIINKIKDHAQSNGYMVSLYGSVLYNGKGNDIDLLFVPWRSSNAEICLNEIIAILHGQEISERYHGVMGTLATSIIYEDMVLDIQFREVEKNPFD